LIDERSIFESLSSVGLNHGDTVLVHADAGVAAQCLAASRTDKLNQFVRALKHYFYDGTILVPSFTYSATKKEVFEPDNTKSQVGLFSEFFRTSDGVSRTKHPIFSFSVWGRDKESFLCLDDTTCFGAGSLFDEFYHRDGVLCCIGCSIDRITFVHYVEQSIGAYYRYLKNFDAMIKQGESIKTFETSYFVRNLDIDSSADLSLLKEYASNINFLKEVEIGRFPLQAISSRNFFEVAADLYRSNKNSLIRFK
jgi:aminoglycoside 3-N-acetyltransferase